MVKNHPMNLTRQQLWEKAPLTHLLFWDRACVTWNTNNLGFFLFLYNEPFNSLLFFPHPLLSLFRKKKDAQRGKKEKRKRKTLQSIAITFWYVSVDVYINLIQISSLLYFLILKIKWIRYWAISVTHHLKASN